jgi:Anti-sigma-K factor rskA
LSDDADFGHVERMLRRAPAPEFLPATLEPSARRAALGDAPSVTRAPRSWRWPAWWRVASAAAVLGAAVAVAVVLTVSGRGGGFQTQYAVTLSGPHGATAVVDFGYASHGVRPMMVHVHGLPPAGAAHYYTMWFRTGGHANVSVVTFDTAAGGQTAFRAVIPAGMTWHHCWVTLEADAGHTKPATVLST